MNRRKVFISDLVILLMPLLLFLSMIKGVPFASSMDEMAAGVGALAIVWGLTSSKCRKRILHDLHLVLGMVALALLSNLVNRVVTVPSYIMNDAFSFLRIFLIYLGTVAILEMFPRSTGRVIKTLGLFSKWLILISFVFGCLNFFGFVNMYNSTRYGIRNFSFIFGNASQFGVFAGTALALYIIAGKSKKTIEII